MLELDEVGQYYMRRNQNYCPRNPRPWSWQSTSPHIDTFNIQRSELSCWHQLCQHRSTQAIPGVHGSWFCYSLLCHLLFYNTFWKLCPPRHPKKYTLAAKSRTLESRIRIIRFNMNQRLGKSWFVIDVCNWFWNWCRVGKVVPLSPLELQTEAKRRFAKISQSRKRLLLSRKLC